MPPPAKRVSNTNLALLAFFLLLILTPFALYLKAKHDIQTAGFSGLNMTTTVEFHSLEFSRHDGIILWFTPPPTHRDLYTHVSWRLFTRRHIVWLGAPIPDDVYIEFDINPTTAPTAP
jgi:hypothetical protein